MTNYSQIKYTYTGGDRIFPIPFNYIKKDYISVGINGNLVDNYTIDNYSIIIEQPLNTGDIVEIKRTTDISDALVAFTGRNDLKSDSLNLSNTQFLHTIQELADLIGHALLLNYLGQWDCKGLILRNVAEGELDTDGVNLAQVKALADALVKLHSERMNNPHKVTKAQIGLGNVDNTADINKPVSLATQAELDKKVDKVAGKGLSSNDYTTAEKQKLAGIEAGANKITKLSELTNDKGFITQSNVPATTDQLSEGLLNKYDKTVNLTAGQNISISGTYPDFTIASTGGCDINSSDLAALINSVVTEALKDVELGESGVYWSESVMAELAYWNSNITTLSWELGNKKAYWNSGIKALNWGGINTLEWSF